MTCRQPHPEFKAGGDDKVERTGSTEEQRLPRGVTYRRCLAGGWPWRAHGTCAVHPREKLTCPPLLISAGRILFCFGQVRRDAARPAWFTRRAPRYLNASVSIWKTTCHSTVSPLDRKWTWRLTDWLQVCFVCDPRSRGSAACMPAACQI